MNTTGTSRRDFLKTAGRIAALWGLAPTLMPSLAEAVESLESGTAPVLWLQGSNCSGCSVSLLNTYPLMPVSLLTKHLSLKFNQTLSTAQGDLAVQVVNETINQAGYVLVVEGAVPLGMPKACMFGGENFPDQLARAAAGASHIVAVGSCACFGGIPAAGANPIGATDVPAFLTARGISKPLVRVPGCPPHPDWMVGTLVHVLKLGLPALDAYQRPTKFFGRRVHDTCPYRPAQDAKTLGSLGCMEELGCRGPDTYADCMMRGWNGTSNNCIFTHTPCIGCTEPSFARNTRFFSNVSL
jgi:hydrogenase small subunit